MVTSRPEIVGTFGIVTTTHWLSTTVGMAILERGGNAFDAAVAAGCVMHIVEPEQNGPGGDVPIVLWSAQNQKVEVICGQGVAPAGATAAKIKALGFDMMPGIGHIPAVVPGSFGAWMLLLQEYGTMSVRDVLSPAIEIARNGFHVKPEVALTLRNLNSFFKEHWPSSAAVYLPDGQVPEADSLLALPAQAETYARIILEAEAAGGSRDRQIEAARRAWYEGFVAEAIDAFFRQPVMDTSGEAHAGFMTGQDLANWRATVEEPISARYHDYEVFKPGPWAQSPVMLQQLTLLKGFDLDAMDPAGADFVHTVQECAKLAFADRDSFYGDPKFADVPIRVLLGEEYNAERRKLVTSTASLELRPGMIGNFGGGIPQHALGSTKMAHRDVLAGADEECPRTYAQYVASKHGDTCHLDIIDKWGNMVSATPSGGWLSGSPVVPGIGIPVSVRGQMFWLDEGHPNCIEPWKRPRTTLTPSLATRKGVPYIAFGTPGGDQQDQWSLHAFLRHIHHGLNLQQAIDAPSFYTKHLASSFYPREWAPGHLAVESTFSAETLAELDRRGHRLEIHGRWEHYNSVTMATKSGRILRAGASPRRMQSCAIGR
jgi:gamma-glutamyltranspeptidase/glutathione hydrolase